MIACDCVVRTTALYTGKQLFFGQKAELEKATVVEMGPKIKKLEIEREAAIEEGVQYHRMCPYLDTINRNMLD